MRSLALVLAIVAGLAGVALLDRGREPEGTDPALALAPAPAEPAAPAIAGGDGLSIDSSSLLSCLGSAVQETGDVPPSPPLSERGVEEISQRIERLRELRFDGQVDAEFLDDEEMDRRISALLDRDYPAALARRQAAVLELLGAIPPGSDLLELTRTALSAQVVGLFVPETEELLVSSSGKAGALEQITLAHELEHALAHDALSFPLPERTRAGSSDSDLAALALIEGDATLTMELYALRYVELEEQLSLLDDPSAAAGDRQLAELPHFLRRQLLFPYEAGLEFVCDRYGDGGWDAVDDAYADPPSSTAELLDGSGRAFDPARIEPRGSLPPPWRRTLTDQIGAAELSWLFAAPGDDPAAALPDPEGAAADWRGGAFSLWQDGSSSALEIALASRHGGDLCGATVAFYGSAFPEAELRRRGAEERIGAPGQSASIVCDDVGVRFGIGPDEATATALTD